MAVEKQTLCGPTNMVADSPRCPMAAHSARGCRLYTVLFYSFYVESTPVRQTVLVPKAQCAAVKLQTTCTSRRSFCRLQQNRLLRSEQADDRRTHRPTSLPMTSLPWSRVVVHMPQTPLSARAIPRIPEIYH